MSQKQQEEIVFVQEDWMARRWRPAMGWMYMVVCIFDFIIFPILWTAIQAYDHQGAVNIEWSPITLGGGGLFHVAMGAVLGVAAWSRGQEKIAGVSNTTTAVVVQTEPINTTAKPTTKQVDSEPEMRNTRND